MRSNSKSLKWLSDLDGFTPAHYDELIGKTNAVKATKDACGNRPLILLDQHGSRGFVVSTFRLVSDSCGVCFCERNINLEFDLRQAATSLATVRRTNC